MRENAIQNLPEPKIGAGNIRQLMRALGGERSPAMKPHLEEDQAVAIDGLIYQDASLEPISPGSEVHSADCRSVTNSPFGHPDRFLGSAAGMTDWARLSGRIRSQ